MFNPEPVPLPLILVLGPPGVGKGRLCKAICSILHIYHLSIGDFCRALARAENVVGVAEVPREVSECLNADKALPGETLMSMVLPHLQEVQKQRAYRASILDNFPRSIEQQQSFARTDFTVVMAISLRCPEETVRERYLGRTDVTRPAGDEALFRLRMNNYVNESPTIEEIYQQKGVLLKVDASANFDDYLGLVVQELRKLLDLHP